MRRIWILLLVFVIFSCAEEELSFVPTVESLYLNQFKVWSRSDIIYDASSEDLISENTYRDLNLQYIFTPDTVRASDNGGESFFAFPDSYIGLDSITFTDATGEFTVSYYVLEIFRMKNGDPRFENFNNPRDQVYPELDGFYLFLHLENKNRPKVEGGRLIERIMMYSEGYTDYIQ